MATLTNTAPRSSRRLFRARVTSASRLEAEVLVLRITSPSVCRQSVLRWFGPRRRWRFLRRVRRQRRRIHHLSRLRRLAVGRFVFIAVWRQERAGPRRQRRDLVGIERPDETRRDEDHQLGLFRTARPALEQISDDRQAAQNRDRL